MARRTVVILHRHAAPAEAAETVADQHERFRSGQRLERLTDQRERALDSIRPPPFLRIEALRQRGEVVADVRLGPIKRFRREDDVKLGGSIGQLRG